MSLGLLFGAAEGCATHATGTGETSVAPGEIAEVEPEPEVVEPEVEPEPERAPPWQPPEQPTPRGRRRGRASCSRPAIPSRRSRA